MSYSLLPDIESRIVALLEGTATGVDRSIPAARFKHLPFDPEYALEASSSAPYPFEIEDGGEFQPLDVPSTLAATHVWHGANLTLRVAYAASALQQKTRQATIQEDRTTIRRTLEDPESWLTISGFSRCVADQGRIEVGAVPGNESGGDAEVMLVLEVPLELTYRENFS